MIMSFALHKKILIVFVVLLAAIHSLPAGAHLGICIGDDGHFEVEAVACQAKAFPNQLESIIAFDEHHKGCIDFETACDNSLQCKALHFSPSRKVQRDRSQTLSNILVKKTGEFFSSPGQNPSILSYSNLHPENNPLHSLRTVVLLI